MPFIETADRTSLFVTDWGSGPPVVFTHAWGLRSDQWDYQVPPSPTPDCGAYGTTAAATAGPTGPPAATTSTPCCGGPRTTRTVSIQR
jgi:pimeloyl-ACP methyl ester carboxylesterase